MSRTIRLSFGVMFLSTVVLLALFPATRLNAQQQQQQQDQQGTSTAAPSQQQKTPDESGGPQGDIGPYAIPKKKDENSTPPPPPPKPKVPEGMPSYSLTVDVPTVNLDVMVTTKDGQFIPGLQKEHFRVLEDGVPQQIQSFTRTEAPITAVLLVEFASTNYNFMYDALKASYTFADTLKKDDYVAVIEFDMKPQILQDFTNDKQAIFGALNMLRIPGFREINTFDALYDTLDRLDRIEGRKEIILVGSGFDTFSKITYDKVLKKVKETPNVTIFTVSTGRVYMEMMDAQYGNNFEVRLHQMDYLQAENALNTFSKMTGGKWYNPRFEAEYPEIFHDIGQAVRNQYSITYKPTNKKLDGSFRKLKVELVQPGSDKPLIVKDQKGKELKYNILARDGYTARHVVE
jgi:VWFA-related protein